MYKKWISIFVIFCMCFTLTSSVSIAKKKAKLSYTKIIMAEGATFKLKMLNQKGKIRWYSSNKKNVTVSKNGKLVAKKIGKANVCAEAGKRKYVCKVVVKRKRDDILVNNNIFTKALYDEVRQIRRKGVNQNVLSPQGIYRIFSILSGMKIEALPDNTSKITGGICLELIKKDGTKIRFTIGKLLYFAGKWYKIPDNISGQLASALEQYKL